MVIGIIGRHSWGEVAVEPMAETPFPSLKCIENDLMKNISTLNGDVNGYTLRDRLHAHIQLTTI